METEAAVQQLNGGISSQVSVVQYTQPQEPLQRVRVRYGIISRLGPLKLLSKKRADGNHRLSMRRLTGVVE